MSFCLVLNLTNTTESYISIEYRDAGFVDQNNSCTWKHGYANTYDNKLKLMPGVTKQLRLYGNESLFQDAFSTGNMRFTFVLENRFGEKYTETFDASILKMPPANKGDYPFVVIGAFNYRIGKMVSKDGKPKVECETVNL